MGFLARLSVQQAVLAALASGVLLAVPESAGAQARIKTPLPSPIVERAPTSAEIVNKAINPGASDPNVPLPRANLPEASGIESPAAGDGPRLYGRGEDGGGVLGLRVPIPADRNASSANARYSGPQATPELSGDTQQR